METKKTYSLYRVIRKANKKYQPKDYEDLKLLTNSENLMTIESYLNNKISYNSLLKRSCDKMHFLINNKRYMLVKETIEFFNGEY